MADSPVVKEERKTIGTATVRNVLSWGKRGAKKAVLAGLVWQLTGCGRLLPEPPLGLHSATDRPQKVEEPPPEVVKIERIPPQPEKDAVWVDGYWRWNGHRWEWEKGSWQKVPKGAKYARPSMIRLPVPVYRLGPPGPDGKRRRVLVGYGMSLLFLPGHWHTSSGAIVAPIRLRAKEVNR